VRKWVVPSGKRWGGFGCWLWKIIKYLYFDNNYPAKRFEVTGDLHRVLAYFENPNA